VVECLEKVLSFCQRQQDRLPAGTHMLSTNSSDVADAARAGATTAGSAPAFTSSLSSAASIHWLRMLCVDMLSSLQTACPGFLRSHMLSRYLPGTAVQSASSDQFVTQQRGKGARKRKVRQHTHHPGLAFKTSC